MADEDKTEDANGLPGLPLEVFEAGVNALAELRDSGQYMVFLGRQSSIKFLGEAATFRQTLAELLKDEVDDDAAGDILNEIRKFCQITLVIKKTEATARFIERNIYGEETDALGDDAKSDFQNLLSRKVDLVSTRICTDPLQRRLQRMETATGPCIEELDAELVTLRRDGHRNKTIEQPFLRIRLRYSTNDQGVFSLFARLPWSGFDGGPVRSFEFECDESDIDLIISRLRDAKQLLIGPEDEAVSRQQD